MLLHRINTYRSKRSSPLVQESQQQPLPKYRHPLREPRDRLGRMRSPYGRSSDGFDWSGSGPQIWLLMMMHGTWLNGILEAVEVSRWRMWIKYLEIARVVNTKLKITGTLYEFCWVVSLWRPFIFPEVYGKYRRYGRLAIG